MHRSFFLTAILTLFIMNLNADELIWQPINPSFGGNSLNGSWLLANAQAQASILGEQEEEPAATMEKDPAAQFQDSLNRMILSRLSSEIVDAITSDGQLTPGQFELGSYSVNIVEQGDTFVITLDDLVTGSHTVIEIPAL